jgi:hypothetical protein
MEAADESVLLAMSRNELPRSEADLIAELRGVLSNLVAAMTSFSGSVQILRALRAKQEMRRPPVDVYFVGAPLTSSKTVATVQLPMGRATPAVGAPTIHIFAVGVN